MGMGSASVLAFKNYEMSLTEFAGKAMNTATEFSRKFSRVSGKIARDTGVLRHEVFRGLQESTSALLEPHDAVALTKKAAILDAGNQSQLRQAVSVALSGYRNKFGKPAKVLDYSYATAQLGQGQVAEFAPALQYVFGFSRGAGIELKEVAAGLAAISATAPSPIMGATQMGAFLTGIARGSTYEQKLIDQGGVTSQDLRDMLRNEGLARTVEFLASKFTGDELQQVFGRKEFVQFVQGTTGRRGIVAQLEKLIADNAESKPIEKFGKDLSWTLQNKFDQFMQTLIQVGVEYGQPLALVAKGVLTVGKFLMDGMILFNEATGGAFAWVVSAAGALVLSFTLIGKTFRMFTYGLMATLTGWTNLFAGRAVMAGAAASAAPLGSKGAAAREAMAAAGTGVAWGAGAAAGEAVAGSSNAKARVDADIGRAASGTGVGVGAGAGTSAGAAASAGASAGAAAGATQAGFDTGAKAWNDQRRAKQQAFFDRMKNAGDEKQAPGTKREAWKDSRRRRYWIGGFERVTGEYAQYGPRAIRGPWFNAKFNRNFDMTGEFDGRGHKVNPRYRLSHERSGFGTHVTAAARMVDDMIAKGHVDPAHRRFAMHSLLTNPQSLNQFAQLPGHGFGGMPGMFASTGHRPLDPHVNPFSPNWVKKKHRGGFVTGNWKGQVDWDKFLLKKHRGKGYGQQDIKPSMVMKTQQAAFDAASMAPWLATDLYLSRHRDTVAAAGSPFKNAGGYVLPPGMGEHTRTGGAAPHRPTLLLPPPRPEVKPDFPKPPPARRASLGEKIMGGLLMGSFMWDNVRSGETYKNMFGQSFGGGFGAGVDGGKFNDFMGKMDDFNSSEEKEGRKGMRKGVGMMAFWLGKMFRLATNPATLAVAAIAAAYAVSRFFFNRTERGASHLKLIAMHEASFFNQEKILKTQADIGEATYERLKDAVNARKGGGDLKGKYDPLTAWFQQPWKETKDAWSNFWEKRRKTSAAQGTLDLIAAGGMTQEEIKRAASSLRMMGIDPEGTTTHKNSMFKRMWNNNPVSTIMRLWRGERSPVFGGDHYHSIKWLQDHDKTMRFVTGLMDAKKAEEQGRLPFSLSGVPWALLPQHRDLALTGPWGARMAAYEQWGKYGRIHPDQHPGALMHYMPIDVVVNSFAPTWEQMSEKVEEAVMEGVQKAGWRIVSDAAGDVQDVQSFDVHPEHSP